MTCEKEVRPREVCPQNAAVKRWTEGVYPVMEAVQMPWPLRAVAGLPWPLY